MHGLRRVFQKLGGGVLAQGIQGNCQGVCCFADVGFCKLANCDDHGADPLSQWPGELMVLLNEPILASEPM